MADATAQYRRRAGAADAECDALRTRLHYTHLDCRDLQAKLQGLLRDEQCMVSAIAGGTQRNAELHATIHDLTRQLQEERDAGAAAAVECADAQRRVQQEREKERYMSAHVKTLQRQVQGLGVEDEFFQSWTEITASGEVPVVYEVGAGYRVILPEDAERCGYETP